MDNWPRYQSGHLESSGSLFSASLCLAFSVLQSFQKSVEKGWKSIGEVPKRRRKPKSLSLH